MANKNKLITAANFRDFDWNKAKLFYHIVKCGSFLKAARLADTDQPSLTRHVQTLEEQVGCPLLIRRAGAGNVILTRKGEELLEKIAPFFLEMRGFCGNSYVEVGGEKKRKIRIVTTYAIAAYIINDPIVAYNKNNPHLIFEIMGEDHTIDIILSDADIAIRPYDSQAKDVQQELLFILEKKLYASAEYLTKYGEPKTIEDLKHHRLISSASKAADYPYADINWILRLGMPKGKLHEPIFISNAIEGRIDAAKKGVGIISNYETMSIVRDANLKNILPDIKDKKIECYFIYPNYFKEDLEITGIKNYLQKVLLFNDS